MTLAPFQDIPQSRDSMEDGESKKQTSHSTDETPYEQHETIARALEILHRDESVHDALTIGVWTAMLYPVPDVVQVA